MKKRISLVCRNFRCVTVSEWIGDSPATRDVEVVPDRRLRKQVVRRRRRFFGRRFQGSELELGGGPEPDDPGSDAGWANG